MNTNTTGTGSAGLRARHAGWVIGLALLASVALAPRLAAQEKSFLWKVQSKEDAIYVVGSIHYLKQENYPLKKSIQDAFGNCQTLVLEIDLNGADAQRAQRALIEKARYPDGTHLEQHIAPETYQLAERRARELGIDISQMVPFKPWFVAISLTSLQLRKAGFDPNYGVDRFLAEQAKTEGKKTRGLESLEFQFGLFDHMSSSEQDSMLRQTLSELDRLTKGVDQLVQSWLAGDVRAVEDFLLAGMKEYPAVYRKVVVERNRHWLAQLIHMLEQGEKALVVVGAAHLVGNDGLIELLKQRGYSVEQQ
jgi:uncharacterized protein YbaP (TraB family)